MITGLGCAPAQRQTHPQGPRPQVGPSTRSAPVDLGLRPALVLSWLLRMLAVACPNTHSRQGHHSGPQNQAGLCGHVATGPAHMEAVSGLPSRPRSQARPHRHRQQGGLPPTNLGTSPAHLRPAISNQPQTLCQHTKNLHTGYCEGLSLPKPVCTDGKRCLLLKVCSHQHKARITSNLENMTPPKEN